MKEQDTKYLSLKEASQVLKTSEKTLRKWVRDGSLTAYRTPGKKLLFKPEDINQMIERSVPSSPLDGASLVEVKNDE